MPAYQYTNSRCLLNKNSKIALPNGSLCLSTPGYSIFGLPGLPSLKQIRSRLKVSRQKMGDIVSSEHHHTAKKFHNTTVTQKQSPNTAKRQLQSAWSKLDVTYTL